MVETRRSREIAEAAEHRLAEPRVEVEIGAELGGGGYELIFTSVDRDIDSATVSLVRGVDAKGDQAVVGLSDRPAGLPAGIMGDSAAVPATAAGAVAMLGMWITEPEAAGGALVRLRCDVTIGDRNWSVIRSVTFPARADVF